MATWPSHRGTRTLACAAHSTHTRAAPHRTATKLLSDSTITTMQCSEAAVTLTFFCLHVTQPLRDLRCGFLLTKPELRRDMVCLLWRTEKGRCGAGERESYMLLLVGEEALLLGNPGRLRGRCRS
jgi:hypothetical protein